MEEINHSRKLDKQLRDAEQLAAREVKVRLVVSLSPLPVITLTLSSYRCSSSVRFLARLESSPFPPDSEIADHCSTSSIGPGSSGKSTILVRTLFLVEPCESVVDLFLPLQKQMKVRPPSCRLVYPPLPDSETDLHLAHRSFTSLGSHQTNGKHTGNRFGLTFGTE
jgi:hypothetical protein